MEIKSGNKKFFTRSLMRWHEHHNDRVLPWKQEKDPYKIWLSEVILQQTRAAQGEPYYLSFIKNYPTITDLANAADEAVFRLWQGLGYYSRCKNMLATARIIQQAYGGKFPSRHEQIIALKGIGPYTAAAIASFAFGLPHAVVDGNVYRVLSRFFGIDTPIDATEGKKQFTALADSLLDKKDSAGYNQAIMDLGATVCTPQQPKCGDCPLQKNCIAFKQEMIGLLPVKSKKLKVRKRFFHYLLLETADSLWIEKRAGKDIWENLHQPMLVEAAAPMNESDLARDEQLKGLSLKPKDLVFVYSGTQRLTHQIIETRFFRVSIDKVPKNIPGSGFWVQKEALKNFAFPRSVLSFFEKNIYF